MSETPKFENNKETDIPCPDCGKLLRVKTNRTNGNQFLGCPGWPDCTYTRGIPEAWIMRAQGQEELF